MSSCGLWWVCGCAGGALQNGDARSLVVVTCLQLPFVLEVLWKCVHVVAQHFHLAFSTAHMCILLALAVPG